MPRRAATQPKEENPPLPLDLSPEEIERLQKNDREKKSWWEMHEAQTQQEKECSQVYVYRLVWPDNAAKPEDEDNNIDIVPSHLFGRDYMLAKHGGGKYMFWQKSKMEGPNHNFKRVVSLPGAPKIPRRYIIIQEEDGAESIQYQDKETNGHAPSTNGTGANVSEVLQQANAAARTANEAATASLNAGIQLITTAASKSLEIVAGSIKNNSNGDGTNAAVAALTKQVEDLRAEMKDQRIAQLEKRLNEVESERANTPAAAAPPSDVEALTRAAQVAGVEGGAIGLLRATAGLDAGKDEGLLDHIGKGLGEGFKTFLSDWGGGLIQLGREYLYVRKVEAMQKQPAGAQVPAEPQPIQPERRSLPNQEKTEEAEVDLVDDITWTIRNFADKGFSGAAVADIVKDKYRPYLGLIGQLDIFKDFNKLVAFCKESKELSSLVEIRRTPESDPEDFDFTEFAQAFFDSFQPHSQGATA